MATRSGGRRNAVPKIASLELSFTATAAVDLWQKLVRDSGMREQRRSSRGLPTASLVAVPSAGRSDEVYLTVGFHPERDTAVDTHWHLEWQTVPSSPVPPDIQAESDRVGGYPRALETLIDLWPIEKRTFAAQVRVTFDVPERKPPYKRVPLPPRLRKSKSELVLGGELSFWDVKPPLGGITTIAYFTGQKRLHVIADGALDVALRSDVYDKLRRDLWERLDLLLG